MKRIVLLCGILCLCAHAAVAEAQSGTPTGDELAELEARALFNAAIAAYDAGRYDDALDSFERAHRRSGRPELLFNVAQCYDRLRRDEDAVVAFERYLEALPDAENRAQVEARIRALREAIARRNAPAVTPIAAAEASERQDASGPSPLRDEGSNPHRGRRIALITTSSVIVVAAIVLTVVLVGGGSADFARSDVGTVFARQGGTR